MGTLMTSAAKLGLILLLSHGVAAEAAEIKVIASTGVAGVVAELGRQFEAETGHKVQSDFAVIAVSRRKIDAGAAFDIAILDGSSAVHAIQASEKSYFPTFKERLC
jgi:ABC-type molybdate transport system substrate-binding protein